MGCFKGPLEDIPKRDLKVTGLICKERFARFSENLDKFRDEFIRLRLALSLTWQSIVVIWPPLAPQIKRCVH